MHRLYKFIVLIVLSLLILSACGGGSQTTGSTSSGGTSRNLKFYVITHGQASDPFWSVIKRGVDQGAKDMGVQAIYEAPATFDMVAQSHLIDSAVAAHPDGLVVSVPDASALGPSIKAAIAAGIPVISINAGAEVAKSLGILVHVGQTEELAGFAGGQKMGAAGAKHALCVNQQVGVATLEQRCKGFSDAMKQVGATVKEIGVNGNNPTQTQQTIEAAIQHDPTIDAILALGPQGSLPAIKALQDLNKAGQIKLATFDLTPDVLQAIKNGQMLFAIDQQPYLQGYLPIVLLTLYKTNLNTIANDVLATGPSFVTSDNVAKVIQLTGQGTR
jgi:simple sugar transport system substrate-binding protein